ncbi:MAG: SBBP repeat-containing protein, partial [Acidobacteriota bacterium]|nr:SBBP repeat-containing protein [Acidobacteriota bacterium]
VTGNTNSTEATFPETVGPDLTSNGTFDAFVAKVNAAGTSLVYAGYIGGSGSDDGRAIAVDASGNAYVTGFTSSTEATFPETGGPDLTFNGGTFDAFVAKVNAAGASLVYAGYIGGGSDDSGFGIAVDGSGDAYVTGDTFSTEATFPETVGPDLTSNGGDDAFVAKISEGVGLTPTPTPTTTSTPTPTSPLPTSTPTLTNTPVGVATATPTFTPPTAPPPANVPTLSFPMLLLLGLGLAVTALFLVRRA